MTIKRYNSKLCKCLRPTEHHTNPAGVWVHYEDHEKEVKELNATVERLSEDLAFYRHQVTGKIVSVPELIEKAKAKPEDLAIPVRGGDLGGNTRI